jgi:rhodanese-related sulfurtransferase
VSAPGRIDAPVAGSAGVAPVAASGELEAILARAAERARASALPYAGAVTPHEAWTLARAGAATIVDVRTRPEWELVGHVPGTPLVEWRRYGEEHANADFIAQLDNVASRDEPLLFLCRSGVRSHHAAQAATRAGFAGAYNILEGFEGDLDATRRRGLLGGWRRAGLPWLQN